MHKANLHTIQVFFLENQMMKRQDVGYILYFLGRDFTARSKHSQIVTFELSHEIHNEFFHF